MAARDIDILAPGEIFGRFRNLDTNDSGDVILLPIMGGPRPPKTPDEFIARAETLRELASKLENGEVKRNALAMAARYEETAVAMITALRTGKAQR
jgi:hypothetical protein